MLENDHQTLLREAWANALECPPPESFLKAVFDALPAAERARLAEHAAECPACAAERALAREFDEAGDEDPATQADIDHVIARLRRQSPVGVRPQADVHPLPSRAARSFRFSPALAAAAVLVVLVAGSIGIWRTTAPSLPEPPDAAAVRGNRLELVSPVGDVETVPTSLRWVAVPETERYRVQLLAVDRAVLFDTTTDRVAIDLPQEVTKQMSAAVVYFWQVEALDATGKRLAWSETTRFRVKPAAEE